MSVTCFESRQGFESVHTQLLIIDRLNRIMSFREIRLFLLDFWFRLLLFRLSHEEWTLKVALTRRKQSTIEVQILLLQAFLWSVDLFVLRKIWFDIFVERGKPAILRLIESLKSNLKFVQISESSRLVPVPILQRILSTFIACLHALTQLEQLFVKLRNSVYYPFDSA